jgi:hypothetical protein
MSHWSRKSYDEVDKSQYCLPLLHNVTGPSNYIKLLILWALSRMRDDLSDKGVERISIEMLGATRVLHARGQPLM